MGLQVRVIDNNLFLNGCCLRFWLAVGFGFFSAPTEREGAINKSKSAATKKRDMENFLCLSIVAFVIALSFTVVEMCCMGFTSPFGGNLKLCAKKL